MIEQETTRKELEKPFDLSAEWILARRPALETVVRPFSAVLIRRAKIIETLHDKLPSTLPERPATASVVSWLTRHPLVQWDACMTLAIDNLVPVLGESFPSLKADCSDIALMIEQHPDMAGNFSRAWLDENEAAFETLTEKSGLPAGALGFVFHWGVSTLLHALRMRWRATEKRICGIAGHCPFCGRLPVLAFLSRPDQAINEFLSGGGGQKYLYCGLCGHQWRFSRNCCPVCETDNNQHLVYYQESETTGERIDVCQHCGHYLLCVDLRQTDAPPSMEMAAVGMIHLDVLAREKGFSPMSWTPWNRID